MCLKLVLSVVVLIFVEKCHSGSIPTVRAVLVCDSSTSTTCAKPFDISHMYNDSFLNLTNETNVTVEALEYSANPYDVINRLTQKQEEQHIDVLLAYGESVAVEAASLLSHDLRIPMFRYGNSLNQACSVSK